MIKEKLLDLLKYPVLVLSILLAFILAEHFLGIDFSRLAKVGSTGLEFYEEVQEQNLSVSSEMENEIDALATKLEVITERLNTLSAATDNDNPSDTINFEKALVENFLKTQSVSDQIAKFGTRKVNGKRISKALEGYIFIGNFEKATNAWSNTVLLSLEQKKINISPDDLRINEEIYKVGDNMVLREQLPLNNRAYDKASKSLGVIPKHAIIKIIDKPVGIDREFAVQWWAKVQVEL